MEEIYGTLQCTGRLEKAPVVCKCGTEGERVPL